MCNVTRLFTREHENSTRYPAFIKSQRHCHFRGGNDIHGCCKLVEDWEHVGQKTMLPKHSTWSPVRLEFLTMPKVGSAFSAKSAEGESQCRWEICLGSGSSWTNADEGQLRLGLLLITSVQWEGSVVFKLERHILAFLTWNLELRVLKRFRVYTFPFPSCSMETGLKNIYVFNMRQ